MARIFISYSRIDEEFARRLAGSLSDAGADIWLDVEDIPAGMNWSTAIQQGLDSCDVMLVIISPESMSSTNVENEWQYALDENKPIVPILWHSAKVHFQLRRIQYIDFANQNYDKAFTRLSRELQSKGITLITQSPHVPAQAPVVTPPMPVRPKIEAARIPIDSPVRRLPKAAIAGVLLTVSAVIVSGIILSSQGRQTPVDEGTATAQASDTPTNTQTITATSTNSQTRTTMPTISAATVTNSVPLASFTTGVNVRRGPDYLFEPPIGSFASGDSAEVLAVNPEGTWYKVRYYNAEGWVLGELLTVSGNINNLPVDIGPPKPTLTPMPVSATRTSQINVNLVAGHITTSPNEKECLETFQIFIDVANLGQDKSPSGTIRVQDIVRDEIVVAQTAGAFPELNPGQTFRMGPIPITIGSYFNEEHTIVIDLDPNNLIAETNESDNRGEHKYDLGKGNCG